MRKKTVSQKNNSSTEGSLIDALPWEEIKNVLKQERFNRKALDVQVETYIFAAKKKNRPLIVESALKSLQETDPEHATLENAEVLADKMQAFARRLVKEGE